MSALRGLANPKVIAALVTIMSAAGTSEAGGLFDFIKKNVSETEQVSNWSQQQDIPNWVKQFEKEQKDESQKSLKITFNGKNYAVGYAELGNDRNPNMAKTIADHRAMVAGGSVLEKRYLGMNPSGNQCLYSLFEIRNLKEAANKTNILYIVHPDAVLEQTSKMDYIKSFIDKLDKAINGFSGQVIITKLDKSAAKASPENKEAFDYVKTFMDRAKSKSNVNVIEEKRSRENPLGKGAMDSLIDSLYLEDKLGKIILGGTFTCDYIDMCVDETKAALFREYGPEHVSVDSSITLKAGIV